jgi:MFS family permease
MIVEDHHAGSHPGIFASPAPEADRLLLRCCGVTTPERSSFRSVLADRAVRNVIVSQFIVMLGFGSALPILPLYARSFGVSYSAAGLFTAGFGLARLAGDVFAGPTIDRFGERRVAPAGMVVVAICAVLTGLAPNFPSAVTAWAVGGLGSAAMFGAQFSYLMKSVRRDRMARTLGVFYGAFNIGIIVGGSIAGLVADRFGFRVPLYVYGGVMLVAMSFYVRAVPAPRRSGSRTDVVSHLPGEQAVVEVEVSGRRGIRGSLAQMMRIPSFPTILVLNFAYLWFINSVFDLLVPLFAQDRLGVATSGIGILFAIMVVAELLILYPAGAWADRYGRRAVLIPSIAALVVLTSSLGFSPNVVVFAVLIALVGLGSGTAGVPPAAMLGDIVPDERSGLGVGMFRFAGDLAFFLGPLTIGVVTDLVGFEGAFIVGSIPLAICLVMIVRMPETKARI